jgi:transposase
MLEFHPANLTESQFSTPLDRRVFLHYAMRRVDCKRCGIKVELVPWAKGKQRMTNDFRHFLSTWARRLTWSEVAAYFRTSWNTVYRAVQGTVEWGLKNRCLSSIEAIGVDEIHIRKGQNY